MDDYKEGYATYRQAMQVSRGRGIIYKADRTSLYKIATKPPLRRFYIRAKEKQKVNFILQKYH